MNLLSLYTTSLRLPLRHLACFSLLAFASLPIAVQAAAPVTTGMTAPNATPGQTIQFSGSATDSDGDLYWIHFYVNDPNNSGWSHIGSAQVYPSSGTTGYQNWTATSQTGNWAAHIRAQDINNNYDSNGNIVAYFANRYNQTTASSQNASVTVNSAFTPSYSGGSGTGGWQFVVGGYTNWDDTTPGTLLPPSNTQSNSWTPTAAGTYSFWVRKIGDNNYYASNIAGPYTLTVNKANQSTVSVSPSHTSKKMGENQTFNASGGSGSGAYTWGGDASGTGSSQNVTFNTTGVRNVTVYRAGDSNYNQSNTATASIVVYRFDWGSTPSTVPSGQSYTVTANVINGGFPYVTLTKNGSYFSAGWMGTQGSTSDTGPTTVNYNASFTDTSNGGSSGSEAKSVTVSAPPPPPPSGTVSGPTSGTVGLPNTYNLGSVSNATDWRWEVDLPGGGAFEWLGSYGTAYSHTWAFGSGNGTYKFRVHLRGSGGNVFTNEVTTTAATPNATAATSVTTSGFTANWTSAGGATGYRLDVSTNSSFSSYVTGYENLSVGNTTSYAVSGLAGGTTYYYRIRATNAGGTSVNSNTVSVTTSLSAPPAPTALSASGVATTSFTANWSASSGATSYRLDVSTSSGFGSYVSGYQDLNVGDVTAASVSGLAAGTTYYYRVRAVNGSGTSGSSNTITVVTLLNAPIASSASNITSSSFTANWSISSGATSYRLDVSTDSSFASYVSVYQNLDVGNVTNYPVSGLSGNTTYYYRVRAENTGGTSGNSNVITVATATGTQNDTTNQNELNVHLPLSQ